VSGDLGGAVGVGFVGAEDGGVSSWGWESFGMEVGMEVGQGGLLGHELLALVECSLGKGEEGGHQVEEEGGVVVVRQGGGDWGESVPVGVCDISSTTPFVADLLPWNSGNPTGPVEGWFGIRDGTDDNMPPLQRQTTGSSDNFQLPGLSHSQFVPDDWLLPSVQVGAADLALEGVESSSSDSPQVFGGSDHGHVEGAARQKGKRARCGPVKCPTCDRVFQDKTRLKQHERYHRKDRECAECDQRFSTRQDLDRHRQHQHVGVRTICPHCPKQFRGNRKDNLRRHIATAHSKGGSL